MPEVESVEVEYPLERKGRAKKLLDELLAAVAEHKSSLQKCQFQLLEYTKFAHSAEDLEMLKKMTSDLRVWLTQSKDNDAFTADLVKTLTKF